MSSQPQPGSVFKPCPECGGRRVEVQDNMRLHGGPLFTYTYAMYLTQNARSSNSGKGNPTGPKRLPLPAYNVAIYGVVCTGTAQPYS
jgi:hypothetical protein